MIPPNIADVLQQWLHSQLEQLHTVIPGQIESYSGHTDRKARVKPLIKMKTYRSVSIEIPPIDNVPVIFPSAASFNMVWPLKKGDGCLIVFSELGMGNYLNSQGQVVDADSIHRFAMTDAICIPGLWPFSRVPAIGSGASIEITEAGSVNINGDSKSFVTHAELNSALQTFINALNLHTHPTAPTGPVSPPTIPMSLDISPAATTKVKTGG